MGYLKNDLKYFYKYIKNFVVFLVYLYLNVLTFLYYNPNLGRRIIKMQFSLKAPPPPLFPPCQQTSHTLQFISALKMVNAVLINSGIFFFSLSCLPFLSPSFLPFFLPTNVCFIFHGQNIREIKGTAENVLLARLEQFTSVTSQKHSLYLVICLFLAFPGLWVINSLLHLCLS